MNELMRDEILDQPSAIRQVLPDLRMQLTAISLPPARYNRLIFCGSGDSYHAPCALQYAARRHLSVHVHVLPAFEATHYWQFSTRDLVVPVSVSGEARHTVAAATRAREAGADVWAITANAESSLAQTANLVIVIAFKARSRKTPHTTDFMTSLLAIAAVIERLAREPFATLDDLEPNVDAAIETLAPLCQELGEALRDRVRFYFLGAGPNVAAAHYAGLKFWEAGGLAGHFFELEEFAHGPHLLVDPGDPVVLIAPDGHSIARAEQITAGLRRLNAHSIVITDTPAAFADVTVLPTPAIDEIWSPFLTSIAIQWLCWAVATAKGYDVVQKDGRHANPDVYEEAHRTWVR